MNDPPTNIMLSYNIIPRNAKVGAVVANLTVTD